MKNVILPLLALSILSVSCSKKTKSKPTRIGNFQSKTAKPIFIKRHITDCSLIDANSINKSFQVEMLIDGRIQPVMLEAQDLLVDNKVQTNDNSIITNTIEQFKSNVLYKSFWNLEMKKNDEYIYQWEKILKEGNDTDVCPGIAIYKSDTVENAALVSNYAISKTNKAIKSLNLGIDIKPIKVFITPSIRTTKVIETQQMGNVAQKKYEADNAYYKPWAHTITFLPHSESAKRSGTFGEASLWEIPMVPSHEYGHHIFNMIVPKYSRAHEANKHSQYCFDNRIEKASKFGGDKEIQGAVRSANFHDTIGSLNEGFADLISFYTLDEDERTLQGVTCMEANRDVSSPVFQDGNKKLFSKNVIKIMSSKVVVDTKRNCSSADFQAIHSLGAVFAHTTDQFISNFTTNKKTKLKVVLKWLQKLNTEYEGAIKSKNIEDSMQAAFEMMVATTLSEFNKEATTEVCTEVNKLYSSIGINFQGDYLKCNAI